VQTSPAQTVVLAPTVQLPVEVNANAAVAHRDDNQESQEDARSPVSAQLFLFYNCL